MRDDVSQYMENIISRTAHVSSERKTRPHMSESLPDSSAKKQRLPPSGALLKHRDLQRYMFITS